MKRINILVILCGFMLDIHGQTPEQNLEKYWNYRKRLEEKFVWISPCNEPGSNIPVSSISKISPSEWGGKTMASGEGYVAWDDGNKILPHYIGLLATEYKLLKDNNIDYARTRDELYYALLALERLDITAETFDFANRSEFSCGDYRTGYGDFNGFFIRDDVNTKTCQSPIWKDYYENGWLFKSNTYFIKKGTDRTNSGGLAMSKDVVWNTMNGLALVKALVDDPTTYPNIDDENQTLSQMVKDISLKILDQLYGTGDWTIRHPLTGCTISDPKASGDVKESMGILGEVQFQYGFCEEIKWINDDYCPYDPGDNAQGGFNNIAEEVIKVNKLYELLGKDNYYGVNSFLSMYTVMGGHFDYILKAVIASPSTLKTPYHLLLNEVLHPEDNNIYKINNLITSFYTWLNHAPIDGPKDYRSISEPYVSDWGTNNVLTEPIRDGFNIIDCGEYPGIDYMLLHNLFWLVYQSRYTDKSKINKFSISFDKTTYVDDSYTAGTQTPDAPAVVSNDYIIATNTLSSNRNVTYDGRISVKLQPGFKALQGSKFLAYTSDTDGDCELQYSMIGNPYIPLADCSRLKSSVSDNFSDDVQLNNTINEEVVPELAIKVFPNPSSGKFSCSIDRYNNQLVTIDIVNITGSCVYKTSVNKSEVDLDLSMYPKGMYVVRVTVDDKTYVLKELLQ